MQLNDTQQLFIPDTHFPHLPYQPPVGCLLYTSDAADDLIGVDLGGSRTLKKNKNESEIL